MCFYEFWKSTLDGKTGRSRVRLGLIHKSSLPPAEFILRHIPVKGVTYGRKNRLTSVELWNFMTGSVFGFHVGNPAVVIC